MRKINVALYGGKGLFGGKEEPLRSETIYCDHADACSVYKEGKCLNCANQCAFTASCPVGRVEHAKGYTRRAKKYWEFKEKATKDEMYSKLSYPNECDFAVLGDGSLFFNLRYVKVWKPSAEYIKDYRCTVDENGYSVGEKGFNSGFVVLSREDATFNLLNRILSYRPQAMFGGQIMEYQEKYVPNILNAMRKLAPELYNGLLEAYPDLSGKKANYIGRYAYTLTIRDGVELRDKQGNKGIKRGNKIYAEDFRNSFLPFGCRSAVCEFTIDENSVVEVLDNDWCDDNTRFR